MPDEEAAHARRRVAVSMLAAWMSTRYYRTFHASDEEAAPFDALLTQRERRIGVTVGALWDEEQPLAGARELARLLSSDVADASADDPGYVIWVPPGVLLPTEEPRRSNLRLALAHGLNGLEPAERREIRLPVTLKLAKIQDDGQYVSVTGVLSREWTRISEGVNGAYHLDSRALHRLPDESAELEIIVSRVRDRAALLNAEEVTDVDVHDYWRVSRLPVGGPSGVTVLGAPPETDPADGTLVRRFFRGHVARAVEQRTAGDAELVVLVLVGALGHIADELATAALRGMNPAAYGALDLVVLVADGEIRQVLQPRSLPWAQPR
ncbi:MAG: hypothetical protein O3B31_12700 [Chloroflexi bacterium]|nr:hypothetical protein [Chloroflexota bacterium]MDA1004184.1 hypothetical protein [Chloroflexota bacterium]MQC28044.1 hypothetical protein [Chloroflexota bacterium]